MRQSYTQPFFIVFYEYQSSKIIIQSQKEHRYYLGNFDKLIVVVMAIKKWLLAKNLQVT